MAIDWLNVGGSRDLCYRKFAVIALSKTPGFAGGRSSVLTFMRVDESLF